MTKHDEIRQILHESGFKFADGRTALEMTDEEVEKWLVWFVSAMSKLSRQFTNAFKSLTASVVAAIEPLQDLGRLLEDEESRDIHGV